jgi:flagellar biosynthetic protein FliP
VEAPVIAAAIAGKARSHKVPSHKVRSRKLRCWSLLVFLLLLLIPMASFAADPTPPGIQLLNVQPGANGSQNWSLSIQMLALMTALTVLPAILLMMTSFTRIVIVLGFLRQALGTNSTPPNQVILGLSLFLTLFVMSPVINKAYDTGIKPYMDGQMTVQDAVPLAAAPFRRFMLDQTREPDLQLFTKLAGEQPYADKDSVPYRVALPAFVTSELKTAFQMGFLLFIPFLIIDLVVASVLMSMGMMMVSPMIISLPFKIMLFVLVDGWTLLLGTLAGSFYQ